MKSKGQIKDRITEERRVQESALQTEDFSVAVDTKHWIAALEWVLED